MKELLLDSIKTSIFDKNFITDEKYQFLLLLNNEEKIISKIRSYLNDCDEFIFLVAFITMSGVSLLLEELKELEKKGISGKILTGDYLNFTEPKALRKINSYKNINLRMAVSKKIHSKIYLFRKNDIWTIVIGSSNLTQNALTTNYEWNLKINSTDDGKIIKEILESFNKLFSDSFALDEKMIDEYEKKYLSFYRERENKNILTKEDIKPNSMQEKALKALEKIKEKEKRALIISATGTGKTFLVAFDIEKSNSKNILFIAHRKNILQKTKESFSKIIKNANFFIYNEEEIILDKNKKNIIFAMVQTFSKDEHLNKFARDFFDYVIIDEVHHSAASSYQKIINRFVPKFLLGLTATPERTDNFDIYSIFDNNVAYEIRLHEAMEENLLCPFHYFGISDIQIDGISLDEKASIKNLTTDERVKHILEKSDYYGYSGDKLRALIFVSKIEEGKILAEKFCELGRKAIFLDASSSDEEREKNILKLERAEINYIISVDIFNEGIDIPSVNQIILLRPTKSSIIYIQQLGRGLRKKEGKEYTIILDFIANYSTNFLIPIAISQNTSYNKDFMKNFMMNATNLIPGQSSVNFDRVAKEKIFENINATNFSNKKIIEHDYKYLEKRLGRTPFLCDFYDNSLVDPRIILKYKKNYDEILKIFSSEYKKNFLSDVEKDCLNFLSVFFTPAKRIHEVEILNLIFKKSKKINKTEIVELLEKKYALKSQDEDVQNALDHLTKETFKNLSTAKPYKKILFKDEKSDFYYLSEEIYAAYRDNKYFKTLIDDLINYNFKYVLEKYPPQKTERNLSLYKNYSKMEAFWLLNLDYSNPYQVSGYTAFEKEKKLLIFITMENGKNRNAYSNDFYDKKTFSWYSKNNRYLERDEKDSVEKKIARKYYGIEVFIKKVQGEDFFYVGKVKEILSAEDTKDIKGRPIIKYIFQLESEIKEEIFNYLSY